MSLPVRMQAGSRNHRIYLGVTWGLFGLLVLLVPFMFAATWSPELFGNSYNVSLNNVSLAIAWGVAILGLNVLTGYSGQISLGNTFFVGVGAYITAILVHFQNWPYLTTLVVVIPACLLVGVVLGIPAVRISGLYLAVITFGLAAVFPTLPTIDALANRDGWNTGGATGFNVDSDLDPPSWLDIGGIHEAIRTKPVIGWVVPDEIRERNFDRIWIYYLVVAIAVVAFLLVRNLMRSRAGRSIIAIRDNEIGAQVSGINPAFTKALAFGISGILGGVAGTMFVMIKQFVSPTDFTTNLAIFFIVGLIVGGAGTLGGSIVGGLAIVFIPAWASQTETLPGLDFEFGGEYGPLLLGAMLIGLMFVLPGGIANGFRLLRSRVITILPAAPSRADTPKPLLEETPNET